MERLAPIFKQNRLNMLTYISARFYVPASRKGKPGPRLPPRLPL